MPQSFTRSASLPALVLLACACHVSTSPDSAPDSAPDAAPAAAPAGPAGPSHRDGAASGSAEICGNGADDDGNGSVDEGCDCAPGAERTCFGGPSEAADKGACKSGVQTCDAAGHWGACVGQVLPRAEVVCNGVDDDCDGKPDTGCECLLGEVRDCYGGPAGTAGIGKCASGKQTCGVGGTWGACEGDITPSGELCGNGVDDDCNGVVDNGCVCVPGAKESCYGGPAGTAGVGRCKAGAKTCVAEPEGGSSWSTCADEIRPNTEVCNGVDDDCDGAVDRPAPRGTAAVVGSVTWPGPMQMSSARVFGSSLYVADDAGLNVFALTSPATPTLTRHAPGSFGYRDLLVAGDTLYSADNYDGLGTWELGPSAVTKRSTFSFPNAQVYGLSLLAGDRLLAVNADGLGSNADLLVLDRASPLAPTSLTLFDASSGTDRAVGVATFGNVAYVNFLVGPDHVYDLTTNTPVLTASMPMAGVAAPHDRNCWAHANQPIVDGGSKRLYVPRCGQGVYAFDISTAKSPVALGDTTELTCTPFSPVSMDVRGTTAVELSGSRLRVIDLGDPKAPVLKSELPLGTFGSGVVPSDVRLSEGGDYAYVTLWRGGVLVVRTH